MFDAESFTAMMRRVRAGEPAAAKELVDKFESLIRREVRMRLEDQRLRRVLDSMDVCQSVLASFFVRTALGEYDLEDPQQLVKLLVTMTRNKVASVARREHADKRDQRRTVADGEAVDAVSAEQATPSQIVGNEDLLNRVRNLLTADERQVAELRCQGQAWQEISATLGGTAQARRVQYSRAIERVRRQLGIDDDDE